MKRMLLVAMFAMLSWAMAAPLYAVPEKGDEGPDFKYTDLNGTEHSLSDLKGKIVVIDFWATWCGPCVKAMPHMEEIHNKFKDQDVVVLGISNETADKVNGFLKDKNFTYSFGLAENGINLYGVKGIPHVYILDPNGKVWWHEHPMAGEGKDMEKAIETCLEENGAKSQIELAKKLVGETNTPCEVFEGLTLLEKIAKKFDKQDVQDVVNPLIKEIRGNEKRLAEAEKAWQDLNVRYEEQLKKIADGGAIMPKTDAEKISEILYTVAKEAGAVSKFGAMAKSKADGLLASYNSGTPVLGIQSDNSFKGDGVKIGVLNAGGAAEKQGFKVGDIIVSFKGEKIESYQQLVPMIKKCKPGDKVEIKILRDEKEVTIETILGRAIN